MVKKLQPKLRFRGFTDAWEPRRLKSLHRQPLLVSPIPSQTYISWSVPAFSTGEPEIVKGSEIESVKQSVNSSDVLLCRINPRINRVWVVEARKDTDLPMIASTEWVVFTGHNSDSYFLSALFTSSRFRNMLLSEVAGVTGSQKRFQIASVLERQEYFPTQIEQARIGLLFAKVDNLIAAEKRKLQLIGMKKRLLLQRILSRKMRFVGFCDSWIQLKLDDAICVCSGKDYKHLSKGNIPVYGTGGYMTSVSKALSNRDAIGIGRKGTIDKPYVLHAPFWTVDTLFYALPRNGYDLNFLFAVFQNINWKSKNESTGLPSLSKKNIENTSIITPSIDEQCRIGELFSLFDSILDETNQKIRLLEKKKKALLRDMFV